MIKITYTSTHMLYFYTRKIASTSPIHPQIKFQDVPCLSLSKVIIIMYGLYKKKRNKRCIAKEGMPHAYKACQKKKKKKKCIPKEGMPHTHKVCQKKERKRKYSPYQKKYYKGERIHIKELHPPYTKNIHTLVHLDQGL